MITFCLIEKAARKRQTKFSCRPCCLVYEGYTFHGQVFSDEHSFFLQIVFIQAVFK